MWAPPSLSFLVIRSEAHMRLARHLEQSGETPLGQMVALERPQHPIQAQSKPNIPLLGNGKPRDCPEPLCD